MRVSERGAVGEGWTGEGKRERDYGERDGQVRVGAGGENSISFTEKPFATAVIAEVTVATTCGWHTWLNSRCIPAAALINETWLSSSPPTHTYMQYGQS